VPRKPMDLIDLSVMFDLQVRAATVRQQRGAKVLIARFCLVFVLPTSDDHRIAVLFLRASFSKIKCATYSPRIPIATAILELPSTSCK
jgi:hypothetical protein